MTSEETEQRVSAFVASEIHNGACPLCLSKLMVIVAIDNAFRHDVVEDVHTLLYRMACALEECRSDHPEARPH
jgi:hypothetical protein